MWFGNQETRKFFIKLVGNGWESAKLRPANAQFLAPLAKGRTNEKVWSSQRCMQSWHENFHAFAGEQGRGSQRIVVSLHRKLDESRELTRNSLGFMPNSARKA
jgi:hypothetical protein